MEDTRKYFQESAVFISSGYWRILFNLSSGENFQFKNIRDNHSERCAKLLINADDFEVPKLPGIFKKHKPASVVKRMKENTKFYENINFERLQEAYDRLLEEGKSKGVNVNFEDMSIYIENSDPGKLMSSMRNRSLSLSKQESFFENSLYESVLLGDMDHSMENSTHENSLIDLVDRV